jgi:hypothetical protein
MPFFVFRVSWGTDDKNREKLERYDLHDFGPTSELLVETLDNDLSQKRSHRYFSIPEAHQAKQENLLKFHGNDCNVVLPPCQKRCADQIVYSFF